MSQRLPLNVFKWVEENLNSMVISLKPIIKNIVLKDIFFKLILKTL